MTHDELLADIKNSCPDNPMCKNCCALRAVVELEDREVESNMFGQTGEYDEGYNQALVDVRRAIEREVK